MSFEHKVCWISASIDARQLTELKHRYKNDINSRRKYSQVNNFVDLIGILMVRGIVSRDDVTILNQLCQDYFRINFSDIPDSLTNARPANAQENHLFFTATGPSTQPPDLTKWSHGSQGSSVSKNIIAIPPNIVDIIVAGNISEKQWRPFARALQVDTGSIAHVTSNADKVRKALTTFLQNTEQHRQWSLLEVALEKVHRIDLREQCRAVLTSQS